MVEVSIDETIQKRAEEEETLTPRLRQLWDEPSMNGLYFRMRNADAFGLGNNVTFESFVAAMREELIKDTQSKEITPPKDI